jgi:pSer/pThr/pTyr-binding forkhead associated (FHA) protein
MEEHAAPKISGDFLAHEPFDAGLELVVVEGAGHENRYPLGARQITMGRKDGAYANGPGRISFADPTVSGHHCSLDWDSRKNRYLLTHHSKTNHTLVNGKVVTQPQHIHVGDKIKMGSLVIQLRLFPAVESPRPAPVAARASAPIPALAQSAPPLPATPLPLPPPVSSATVPVSVALAEAARQQPAAVSRGSYQILVLNGPDAANLLPVASEIQLIQEPGGPHCDEPVLEVRGLHSSRATLMAKGSEVHVTSAEGSDRPYLIDSPLPGVVRQRNPGTEFGNLLTADCILVAGKVGMLLVPNDQAQAVRAKLLSGETVSPLQQGLFREGDRVWNRGEQHVLRFMSGPLKGLALWLDPRHYQAPITIGRLGQKTLVELTDRGAAQVQFHYRGESFHVKNVDTEARVPVNTTEVEPGHEVALACGDRIRLGRTLVRYEYLPIQNRIDTYSVLVRGKELPLQREVNLVGSAQHCDIRVDDERISPEHGRIIVGEGSLRYQHRQAGTTATVNQQELNAGQEATLRVGTLVGLCTGVDIQISRRSAAVEGSGLFADLPTPGLKEP